MEFGFWAWGLAFRSWGPGHEEMPLPKPTGSESQTHPFQNLVEPPAGSLAILRTHEMHIYQYVFLYIYIHMCVMCVYVYINVFA